MEEDPFEPQAPAPKEKWIDKPGVRSALLQASLSLLSGRGNDPLDSLTQAVGAGGEAYQRSNKFRLAEEENTRRNEDSANLRDYRDQTGGRTAKGGLTMSQRLSQQRNARKDFEKWVTDESKRRVDAGEFASENAARSALMSAPDIQDQYKKYNSIVTGATGETALMSSAQAVKDLGPQLAQLKRLLAAGDPVATQHYQKLRGILADPEALDAYMGGISGE